MPPNIGRRCGFEEQPSPAMQAPYALGDLCADEGDDGRALLRADHGHLRSIFDADGYGRAELYAVGHKRADQVRRIRSPLHLSV